MNFIVNNTAYTVKPYSIGEPHIHIESPFIVVITMNSGIPEGAFFESHVTSEQQKKLNDDLPMLIGLMIKHAVEKN